MSAKSIIYGALTSYTDLTNLVPTSNITQKWYDKKLGHPQITITRVSGAGVSYGDNGREVTGSLMQVDIWTTQSPTAIETEVINSLLTIPEENRSDYDTGDPPANTNEALNRVLIEITIYENKEE